MSEKKNRPNWQKEFNLYSRLKTGVVIEGNINDNQVYYLPEGKEDIDGDVQYLETEMYFYKTLKDMGYKIVMFFSHIDGFYTYTLSGEKEFDKNKDYKAFFKVVAKAKDKLSAEEAELLNDLKNDDSIFTNPLKGIRESKFKEAVKVMKAAMRNQDEPVALVLSEVSRYLERPDSLDEHQQYYFSDLCSITKTAHETKGDLKNIMVFLTEKSNDIPAWFYLDNPMVKTIAIPLPDFELREEYLLENYEDFPHTAEDLEEEKKQAIKKQFSKGTDGFKFRDLISLQEMMNDEALGVCDVKDISTAISRYRTGDAEDPWVTKGYDLSGLEEALKKRIKGQDEAIAKAAGIIKTAVLGLSGLQHSSSSSKPKGVMFLAGPTGTGKTELAKAISEWLFGTEEHVTRFDMSEYRQEHTDQKLLGAPAGYVGYERGGILTEAVKKDPFAVILFDEIEKAHASILDKFLQLLEDGRITDGRGETVYFSDTLIIFTSNKGITREVFDERNRKYTKEQIVKYGDSGVLESDPLKAKEMYNNYQSAIMNEIDSYFNNDLGRPEIKNRIGENFIVFNFISPEAGKMIADNQIKKIIKNLFAEKNIILDIPEGSPAQEYLYNKVSSPECLENGGRGVGNVIECFLLRPISNFMVENCISKNKRIILNEIVEEKGIARLICDIESL